MFREIFKDDYKKIGKKVIKPFSFLWWAYYIGGGLLGVGSFFLIYIELWFFFGA